MDPWLVAALLGVLQGLLEWLPVSSEGGVAIVRSAIGAAPDTATRYALFLHAGTALAAAAYYRSDLRSLAKTVPNWRPRSAFRVGTADLSFLALATLSSGVVGIAGYLLLSDLAAAATGGAFVAGIGALLVATGVFMRVAEARATGYRDKPTPFDAVLIGGLQGIAVLPGVSRSGTTVSALLLRGYDGPQALQLSFMLSIPAAGGAGMLVVIDSGLPGGAVGPALVALGVSAVVGYLAVDALVRLVERIAFWRICVGFGGLAVVGGALVLL